MKYPASYTDYLLFIERHRLDDHASYLLSDPVLKQQMLRLQEGFDQLMPATYVLDLTRRKYLHVSGNLEQLTGYNKQALLDGGTEFGLSIWNSQDLQVFNRHIFPDNLRVLRSVPLHERSQLRFECNYRVRTRAGEMRDLLQQSVYLVSSDQGLPLVSMGTLTDISRLRNDGRISHSIFRPGVSFSNSTSPLLLREQYFSDEQKQQLSVREIEVLKWICEGLDSNAIAKKMSISLNTVYNHRRHIIAKTRCKTVALLFRYAINHGYL